MFNKNQDQRKKDEGRWKVRESHLIAGIVDTLIYKSFVVTNTTVKVDR